MYIYENEPKTKSEWTKADMIDAIETYCEDHDLLFEREKVKGISKGELFQKFFRETYRSWIHNKHWLCESAVRTMFRELTPEERSAKLVAFAVFSKEQESLKFYKRPADEVPTVGDMFDGAPVTKVYRRVEDGKLPKKNYPEDPKGPWHSDHFVTVKVVDDGIKPTSMAGWFRACDLMISCDLNKLDTSDIKDLSYTFSNCWKLESLDGLQNLNVSNVESLEYTFYRCSSLTSLKGLESWDVSKVYSLKSIFSYCGFRNLQGLENWNVSKVKDMSFAFQDCKNLETLDSLANWNVSNVTSMAYMFNKCSQLKNLRGLENWNVSKVKDLFNAFSNCETLTSLDGLNKWNTSAVEDMIHTFSGCTSLSCAEAIENWDTSSVRDMSYMFSYCTSLTSLDLSGWDTASLGYLMGTFLHCDNLRTLDLPNLDTSCEVAIHEIFNNCYKLKTIYVSTAVEKIRLFGYDFKNCVSLVGGNGTTYDPRLEELAWIDSPEHPGYFTLKSSGVKIVSVAIALDNDQMLKICHLSADEVPTVGDMFDGACVSGVFVQEIDADDNTYFKSVNHKVA